MKQPVFKVLIAIFLGLLVLMLSSAVQMTIMSKKSIIENYSVVENISMHLPMFIFSVLIILLLNKGKLKEYGFIWNMNFPIIKIIVISILIGFIFSVIGKYFIHSTSKGPTSDFSLIEQIIYTWFLASISEEVLTRGLIQGYLSPLKHVGFKLFKYFISLPIFVGALFFGAMHLALLAVGVDIYTVMNIVVFATILGLIAGYQKEKTSSLTPAIIVHMCFNIGGGLL